MSLSLLRTCWHGLAALFYPGQCQGCNRSLHQQEQVLCLHCLLELPKTNFHLLPENTASGIFIGRVPIEHAVTFVYFTKDGMVQQLLHRFKYRGKQQIGTRLGGLLAMDMAGCSWVKEIDTIIPVPLHRSKEKKRGFNQAAVFAQGIGDTLAIPVNSKVLIRTKPTASQTTKSRLARLENVTGVFETAAYPALEHKHVLLVDDVLTTGATLEACALALLKIKGIKISIATIAIAID